MQQHSCILDQLWEWTLTHHLLVQIQKQKHQYNVWNLFKVNNIVLASLLMFNLNRFHILFWCFHYSLWTKNPGFTAWIWQLGYETSKIALKFLKTKARSLNMLWTLQYNQMISKMSILKGLLCVKGNKF